MPDPPFLVGLPLFSNFWRLENHRYDHPDALSFFSARRSHAAVADYFSSSSPLTRITGIELAYKMV